MYGTAIRTASILLILLLASPIGSQQRRRLLTVRQVITQMENALTRMQDYKASYTLVNGTYTVSGNIFYMKPLYLRVNSMTDGVQLVTNGKMLWIFIPRYGIVAEQELVKSEDKLKILLATSGKSLQHMRREYSFQFAPGGKTDPNHYILDLKPRVTKIGFKKIRLWVDKTSGLITKVESKTVNGRAVNITFTGITTNSNPPLTKGLFYFGMPDSNVQTIRNTILPGDYLNQRR